MRFIFSKSFLILLAVAAAGYWAYGYFMGVGGPGGPMEGGAPVSVAEPVQRNVRLWHEFSGRLIAVNTAEIRPRVSGTVEEILFKEGERVKKGQPLFTIDPRPYEAALQAAKARAALGEVEFRRAQELVSDRAVAKRDLDQRRSAMEVARAELKVAQLNYDFSTVRAPFDGRVGRPEVTLGNLVESGGNAPVLTTVVTDSPIYADFNVDEQTFLSYLKFLGAEDGKAIPVYIGLADAQDTPYAGQVQSFDNQLDLGTGTIRVRGVFENTEGKLVPGLYARVRLGEPEEKNALLITDRAVNTDQNKKYVLVVGKDNIVEYRPVELGPIADGMRVVNSGLQPGEKIIVNGLQRARPGMPVTPELVSLAEEVKPSVAPVAQTSATPEILPAQTPAEEPQPAAGPEGEPKLLPGVEVAPGNSNSENKAEAPIPEVPTTQ